MHSFNYVHLIYICLINLGRKNLGGDLLTKMEEGYLYTGELEIHDPGLSPDSNANKKAANTAYTLLITIFKYFRSFLNILMPRNRKPVSFRVIQKGSSLVADHAKKTDCNL